MARDLAAQTNVDPISVDYPSGRMRNDSGVGDGTPVSEAINGDLIQFFQKAMRDAGITPNDLPDNTTNGWQLNDAVNLAAKIFDNEYGWTSDGLTFAGNWGDNGTYPVQYRKIGSKVEWRGIAENLVIPIGGTPDIFSAIPVELFPLGSGAKLFPVGVRCGGQQFGTLMIKDFGVPVELTDWPDPGTTAHVNFDGISYYV